MSDEPRIHVYPADKGVLTAKDITDAVVAEPVDEEAVKP